MLYISLYFQVLIWHKAKALGENVVVQRNSTSLVFSSWSFIESQIRVYRKIENNTHIYDASLRYSSTKTSYSSNSIFAKRKLKDLIPNKRY